MKKTNKHLLILLGIFGVLSIVLGSLTLTHFMPTRRTAITMPTTANALFTHADSHNLMPIASNQWYSNIYAQFPTEPLYTLPAAFQLSPQGVGVSLPNVTKTANTI
ncbi:MAG TPA: hypothetical protein VEP90_28720, partial [Methylomirabilota bacterium]|nr:hypothetical protein [Methylomirabilota bacterium]